MWGWTQLWKQLKCRFKTTFKTILSKTTALKISSVIGRKTGKWPVLFSYSLIRFFLVTFFNNHRGFDPDLTQVITQQEWRMSNSRRWPRKKYFTIWCHRMGDIVSKMALESFLDWWQKDKWFSWFLNLIKVFECWYSGCWKRVGTAAFYVWNQM